MADRVTKTCNGCNDSDTHSHHIQYAGFIHPVTKEPLDFSISKHIQCCAADGCEVCQTDVEFAPVKEIGDEFTAYMQNKTDEHLTALTERHGVLTPLSPVARAEEITQGVN